MTHRGRCDDGQKLGSFLLLCFLLRLRENPNNLRPRHRERSVAIQGDRTDRGDGTQQVRFNTKAPRHQEAKIGGEVWSSSRTWCLGALVLNLPLISVQIHAPKSHRGSLDCHGFASQ